MPDYFGPLFLFIGLGYWFWMMYDLWVFTDPNGGLKRGVLVWRERLPQELLPFLNQLTCDIVEGRDFIRKEGNQILVKKRIGGKVLIHEVALINLDSTHPQFEYRVPWSGLVGTIIILGATIPLLPIILFALIANHYLYSTAISSYIRTHMQNAGESMIISNLEQT